MHALKWAHQQRNLGGPATAVLCDLADRATDTGVCWPAVATIAADTGYDRRTVQRALRRLEVEGLLMTRRTGRGTRYTLAVSAASEASESHIRGVTLTPLRRHSDALTQKNPKEPNARARAKGKTRAPEPRQNAAAYTSPDDAGPLPPVDRELGLEMLAKLRDQL